jgi:hypothetical protein
MGIPQATYITCSVIPDGKSCVDQIQTYPTAKRKRKKQQTAAHSGDVEIEGNVFFFSDDEN